jgi:hypothetical protein
LTVFGLLSTKEQPSTKKKKRFFLIDGIGIQKSGCRIESGMTVGAVSARGSRPKRA